MKQDDAGSGEKIKYVKRNDLQGRSDGGYIGIYTPSVYIYPPPSKSVYLTNFC